MAEPAPESCRSHGTGDIVFEIDATLPDWKRWKPSALTSAHWYNPESLHRLIGAEVAFAEDHGLPQRPVRDFIADFRGLTRTAKTKAICDGLNLSRRSLADVVLDPPLVASLLAAMKAGSREVKPKDLGLIGRDHLLATLHRRRSAGRHLRLSDERLRA